MIMQNRSLIVAAIALSLTTMTGCSTLPSLSGLGSPGAAPTGQSSSSLKILINSPRLTTQALDLTTIAIHVKLEFPYTGDAAKTARTMDVQSGVPAVFSNVIPGHARLTVVAQDVTTNVVYDTQSQWVDLLPGVQAQAQFTLTVGGSSAADIGISFGANTKDLRTFSQNDGYNLDFSPPQGFGGPQPGDSIQQVYPFSLVTTTATTSVTFTRQWGRVTRQIGTAMNDWYPIDSWFQIPSHAAWVDSKAAMTLSNGLTFLKVRHFQWTNTYTVSSASHTYTFDRWVSAGDGLIQETVTENGGVISTLTRTAATPQPTPFPSPVSTPTPQASGSTPLPSASPTPQASGSLPQPTPTPVASNSPTASASASPAPVKV